MATFLAYPEGVVLPCGAHRDSRFKVLQPLGFQVPGSWVSVQYYNSLFSCQALQNSFILEELLINIRVCDNPGIECGEVGDC